MRKSILIALLLVGTITAVIVAQSDRPLVFARVCNIEPGKKEPATAAAVAAEWPPSSTSGSRRWR